MTTQPETYVAATGSISDGYHTFDELYSHRHTLFLAFLNEARYNMTDVFCSLKHGDGTSYPGYMLVGATLPTGQISYHLPTAYLDTINSMGLDIDILDTAPVMWDGHTAEDVVTRIHSYMTHTDESNADSDIKSNFGFAIHNIIGHPVSGCLFFASSILHGVSSTLNRAASTVGHVGAKMTSLGIRIHNGTLPK